jgi:protein O-GlcNAc transferase
MLSWRFSRRRLLSILFAVLCLVGVLSLHQWLPASQVREYLPKWNLSKGNSSAGNEAASQERLGLDALPEYNLEPYVTPSCEERYGRTYLEKMHETSTGYCTPESQTEITCFHTRMSTDKRLDMFCLGNAAVFDRTDEKFGLGCELRGLTPNETAKGIPELSSLSSYWYETGPKILYDAMVKLDTNTTNPPSTPNYTILLKREGAGNLWHCMMEIWSMTMTIDVLRTSIDPATNKPFFSLSDAENTQILIIDDEDNGPYFELWTLFAKRPIIRLNNITEDTKVENLILPLAGASNPLWQGDWDSHPCEQSELLPTFTHRILDFYKIENDAPRQGDIVLTYIDRKESRRLVDHKIYFEELLAKIPHLVLRIVDFSAITLSEQLKTVRETDILIGVHGAGLTHGMFLREGSVVVEILPETLDYKVYRNLANLARNTYFSAHASPFPESGFSNHSKREDWHFEDVYIEKDRFMKLMEVAVKTMYNKGYRDYDVR